MIVTGNQLRAARALIGMDMRTLAERAGVDAAAIAAMEERGAEQLRISAEEVEAAIRALEQAGIVFSDRGGPGVRLKAGDSREEGIRPSDLDATNDD